MAASHVYAAQAFARTYLQAMAFQGAPPEEEWMHSTQKSIIHRLRLGPGGGVEDKVGQKSVILPPQASITWYNSSLAEKPDGV